MSIANFKAQFSGSGARANQFRVIGAFPPGVVGGAEASRKLEFLRKAASLPASSIGEIIIPFRGREIKVAGDRTFAPWVITILNDEDFKLRNAFESWSNLINSHVTNIGVLTGPGNLYMQTWRIDQLSRNGSVLASYEIVDSWPSEISDIPVSFDASNTIEDFTVTMSFGWWVHLKPAVITT